MAISLGSNLALHTRLPLDDRTIMETIEEMKDYPENFLPDIAYCFVKADGKMYVFNRENESTELTGKWREYGSGGGTPTPFPTPENYYTKDETEKLISENVQTLTDDEITNILSEIF